MARVAARIKAALKGEQQWNTLMFNNKKKKNQALRVLWLSIFHHFYGEGSVVWPCDERAAVG